MALLSSEGDVSAQVVTVTDRKIGFIHYYFIQDYWTVAQSMKAVGLIPPS